MSGQVFRQVTQSIIDNIDDFKVELTPAARQSIKRKCVLLCLIDYVESLDVIDTDLHQIVMMAKEAL